MLSIVLKICSINNTDCMKEKCALSPKIFNIFTYTLYRLTGTKARMLEICNHTITALMEFSGLLDLPTY